MDYKIIMPVLSDTMDKGKLIKWRVKEGDVVHKGDVIAEVESDKAIMEVQTFKDGVVKKLLVHEGDEVPVKEPIAIIDTEAVSQASTPPAQKPKKEEKPKTTQTKPKPKPQEEVPPIIEELLEPKKPLPKGSASPAAKKEAATLGIDIEELQKEQRLPTPAHIKDIQKIQLERYFTPKALKLLKEYNIEASNFSLDHKIDGDEVLSYIKANNIPKTLPLSSNRKAVRDNVEQTAKKPVYYVFETFDIKKYEGIKLTSLFLKAIGDAMQKHPLSRAVLSGDTYKIYPHSNISVAVAKEDALYMVVCKNIEEKSLKEIDAWVREVKKRSYTPDDLQGSTFGISNLGMFGIERFSAMINKQDCGIAAFGALQDSKIEVTFTFDHRILNGVDAAKFVIDIKKALKELYV